MSFNIRVYGIMLRDDHLLVSDENINGYQLTKFPGGGLEEGEGTRDCLIREFMEEMQWNIEVDDHIYTTDFYQQSAFNPDDQIISIYYLVSPLENKSIQYSREAHFGEMENFRWVHLDAISEQDITLPIDKIVFKIVAEKLRLS